MRQIKYIVLHCTAGAQTQSLASIKAHWRNQGWKTDGYHHLISHDGAVNDLVPIEKPSNGVKGYNSVSINICYKGGVDLKTGRPLDNRTDLQKAAMKGLVLKYKQMFPDAIILGHRDFSPDKNRDGVIQPNEWMKACPSFSVKEWLQQEGIANNPVVIK
ncbi:MAG: N-acetylmuramoyl-L-alanine amidase [Acinetobacter sp.]|uniref:N-acetylmuramoyl-L-alanine amidase n=1 Tax=Acinetobacter sp. TaxID=472 RepID=UPI000FBC3FCD|nr:N-acetylmuramoyl-L-alanine amidase [Acinetobacter sp.]RUP39777.1 MAG: N-acetylmuramoyl-L-alanine amidase [Acinetobacter sp.]